MLYHDTTFFCTFSLILTRSFCFLPVIRLIWSSYYEPLLNTWDANYFRIFFKCWSSIGSLSKIWLIIARSALNINITFKSSLSCNFDVKYELEQKNKRIAKDINDTLVKLRVISDCFLDNKNSFDISNIIGMMIKGIERLIIVVAVSGSNSNTSSCCSEKFREK